MKRFLTLFIFLAMATAHAQSDAGETSGELIKPSPTSTTIGGEQADKVAKVPTLADDQRTQKILNSLAIQSGWFPSVKIGVTGGVVTLEGHTKDAEQLSWLAKTADRLPTVIAVINKTTVDQPPVTDLTPAWNEFMRLLNKAKRSLPLFLVAGLMIAAFWFLSRHVYNGFHSLWGRHINNPFLLSTVTKLTMIPVWLLLFYLVLQTAGLSSIATTIIGGTGAVGIVLGFAFKDIAENYLSGLLLAIRSPFTKGDDVTVAGYDGYIQALNMRGTTILAYDGTLILVPNSIVIQSVIKNRTTNPNTRVAFDIGISHHDSATKAIDLINKTLASVPGVLKDPAPWVIASDLSDSFVKITSRIWVDTRKSSHERVKSNAIACVKETLLSNGISIPDAAREIIFTDALKIQQVAADVDPNAYQNERSERVRKNASENLNQTQNDRGTDDASNPEDQIKKLGEGVDIMAHKADRELIKNASL